MHLKDKGWYSLAVWAFPECIKFIVDVDSKGRCFALL